MSQIRIAIAILVCATACSSASPEEHRRRRFAVEFTESVQRNTPLFREYCTEEDAQKLRMYAAPRIGGLLAITHDEHHDDGTHEYGGRCGPNASCLVFVYEKNGKIVKASGLVDSDQK